MNQWCMQRFLSVMPRDRRVQTIAVQTPRGQITVTVPPVLTEISTGRSPQPSPAIGSQPAGPPPNPSKLHSDPSKDQLPAFSGHYQLFPQTWGVGEGSKWEEKDGFLKNMIWKLSLCVCVLLPLQSICRPWRHPLLVLSWQTAEVLSQTPHARGIVGARQGSASRERKVRKVKSFWCCRRALELISGARGCDESYPTVCG